MPSFPSILAFGDSLIAGYGLSAADGFSGRLQRALRRRYPDARVDNAGVSGDTSADALRRLPRVLTGLSQRPDLAIVQVGPNDVIRSVPALRMRANLDAILAEFARCGIPVLLATVTPPAFFADRALAYAGIHAAVAAPHNAATAPFFPPGVLGHPAMVLADRVHPNAVAIAAVVDHLLPTVEGLLAQAAAARAA
ncbi:arylesterase [Sphingomonas sp. NBWT7]|uniref:GDSL-type esterase/lipase family protein n=1 Tax=Sphingomonas sp. NBWT7 TaxID=2596913 RepID=UPI001628D2A5|nr:GDSL-type esterase/lipase family protein [Sphingomonas sp. NBWT7]QNE33049.1 arylesterase [Sphingomonas sp. NBWT7]